MEVDSKRPISKMRRETDHSKNLSTAAAAAVSRRRPSLWRGYGMAVLASVVASLFRFRLNLTVGYDAPLLISIIAVAFAAWYGGLGPGIVATLIGLVGGIALFVSPWGDERLTSVEALRLLLFLATGLIVSSLIEALYRTVGEWQMAEQEKEYRVLQERNRMAREIHDTLAQGLTGIIIQLEVAEHNIGREQNEEAQRHLIRARDLARESLAEARRSVQALRPEILEERDLAFALGQYIERLTEGSPVQVAFEVEGEPPAVLRRSHDIESNLLRIGLEAVTNVLKHSQARHSVVRLIFAADTITLSVRDDGVGFAVPSSHPNSGGFGLTAMRERSERIGGRFQMTTHPDEGTEISVSVPLPPGNTVSAKTPAATAAAPAISRPAAPTGI